MPKSIKKQLSGFDKTIYTVARFSQSEPGVLRLVADPSKAIGTTFVPYAFPSATDAQVEADIRGEGFFVVAISGQVESPS